MKNLPASPSEELSQLAASAFYEFNDVADYVWKRTLSEAN
jgi:hypothetical protein